MTSLLEKMAEVERKNAEQREEIARLKGLTRTPDVKPSGMVSDRGTGEASPPRRSALIGRSLCAFAKPTGRVRTIPPCKPAIRNDLARFHPDLDGRRPRGQLVWRHSLRGTVAPRGHHPA